MKTETETDRKCLRPSDLGLLNVLLSESLQRLEQSDRNGAQLSRRRQKGSSCAPACHSEVFMLEVLYVEARTWYTRCCHLYFHCPKLTA